MTREEFYKLTDILNSEVLGNFMHGGEAGELIAMFEEVVEHSNILEQEEPVSEELEEAAKEYSGKSSHPLNNAFKAGANWHKEQMLAKSIEGTARPDDNEIWCDLNKFNLADGDKVKIIVIKED